jgi:UDP-N-acetylmuramate: L-alanyl-gamma-D-glutamyl-meso-diaminopimelate ligase
LNAVTALAATVAAGVSPTVAIEALASFKGIKRRLELISQARDICVYDDFAHHPTAIRLTLEGLRRKVGNARILVGMEPRSNTMRAGVHANELGPALIAADHVWLKTNADIDWDPKVALAPLEGRFKVVTQVDDMLKEMQARLSPGDHVVFMSNGGFGAAPHRLATFLKGG